MSLRKYFLGNLKQLCAIAALAAFAAGCGQGHSPMASTGEVDPAIGGTDELVAPAAKKPAKDTTESTTADDPKVTSKKRPSRYSIGGGA
jgi:hypothetical protein